MSGLPISLALDDQALEAIAQRVAQLLAEREPTSDEWMTVAEAADYLRCPKSRIYDATSARRLRVHKDGTRSLYRRSDLDAYLEEAR